MRVKISWDQGSTFEREAELDDVISERWDAVNYNAAMLNLDRIGRYWLKAGDNIALLMKVR